MCRMFLKRILPLIGTIAFLSLAIFFLSQFPINKMDVTKAVISLGGAFCSVCLMFICVEILKD